VIVIKECTLSEILCASLLPGHSECHYRLKDLKWIRLKIDGVRQFRFCIDNGPSIAQNGWKKMKKLIDNSIVYSSHANHERIASKTTAMMKLGRIQKVTKANDTPVQPQLPDILLFQTLLKSLNGDADAFGC
jgi:hypothetical protein